MVCIAISFLVMIIAVAVSSGFRNEIRRGVSSLSGDIQLTPPNLNVLDNSRPIERDASYLSYVKEVKGVKSVDPVIYRAGIIKQVDNIHGVLFKGLEGGDGGGTVIAEGTPEKITECEKSYTGIYIKKMLQKANKTKKNCE